MYLKCHRRHKDGKEHRYWSIVESRRTARGVAREQVGIEEALPIFSKTPWMHSASRAPTNNNKQPTN